MADNHTDASNLELLLETLIKMVGKTNQKVDSLQRRVIQLETFIMEQQLEAKERGTTIEIHSTHPLPLASSAAHSRIFS